MRHRLGNKGLLSDDDRQFIVFNAPRRSYRANNPSRLRVLRYLIDGAVINHGERCDYAFGLPNCQCVYLLEIKGKNIKKAANQLLATLDTLAYSLAPYTVHGRIVLNRIPRPDLRASNVIRLERRLAQKGGNVIRSCKVLEESI